MEEVHEVNRAGAARPTSLTALCGEDEGEYSRSSPQKMREREVVCRPGRRSLATLCSSVLSFSVPPCLRGEISLATPQSHLLPIVVVIVVDKVQDKARDKVWMRLRRLREGTYHGRHGVAEEMRVEEVHEVARAGAARPTSLTYSEVEEMSGSILAPLLRRCGSERSVCRPGRRSLATLCSS